jgi:O-antigen/teichoic acid export membrane protein
MLWPVVAVAFSAALISVPLRQPLSSFLFADPHYGSFAVLTILWAASEAVFTFLICCLQSGEHMRRLAVVQIGLNSTRAILIVALSIAGYDLKWVIASVVGVGLIYSVIVLAMIVQELGFPPPSSSGLGRYLAFSIPQMPSGILLWSIGAGSRYFLTHLMSLSDAGVFSASYTLGNLIALFFNPIAFVLSPALAKAWEQKQQSRVRTYLERSSKLFLGLAIPAVAGLYILSEPLLRVLTTSEYAVGSDIVLLVSVGTLFLGIQEINLYVIYLVQKTRWMPLMYGAAAAASVGLNVALIPRIGIAGAAISIMVSYFLLAGIVTVWARTATGYRFDWLFLFKVILAAAVMAVCVSLIPVSGVASIVLAVIMGTIIFGVGLLILRAFSKEERQLIKGVLRFGFRS